MRAFFAQIDWIRNTFFFVFYFFLVVGIFLGAVKPQLDSFRNTNAKYRKELFVVKQIEEQKRAEIHRLEEYKANNNAILGMFNGKLTKQDIEDKLAIYFNTSGIVADGAPLIEGNYYKQRYVVSGQLKDINTFREALNLTKQLNGLARFSFPIHIEREGEMLTFSFRLDVYYLPN